MVSNVHERDIAAPLDRVGALIDSLSSASDLLWPRQAWPAMRLDTALGVKAAGGHGPIRYVVTHYEPGRHVTFRFTAPSGFNGHHAFTAAALPNGSTRLSHELSMSLTGSARYTWPLFFRPLHNALIEECFDRAETSSAESLTTRYRRSLWVKILRAGFSREITRRRRAAM